MAQGWSLGLDVGASAAKAVLLDAAGQPCARAVRKSGADFAAAAKACRDEVVAEAGVDATGIERVVATGYGRRSVDFATSTVTEITCHARGCYQNFPHAITIVDIGGQDNKVIVLADGGDRRSFKMNRKCAAGTGAFLEEIANRCTVFAKTELLKLIAQGTPLAEMARAAYRSVVKRILEMDPLAGEVVMTGGVVAHNPIIVELVSAALGRDVLVPHHPQYTGALGAALIARDA